MTDDAVRAQYEALPYPPRDPKDEAKRLVTGSPSNLPETEHYVFGGRIDRTQPFRALIAGGGTGDATIMLAQQLADGGFAQAEIVYLDWAESSRKIAAARAAARKLANLRFVTASLTDLPKLDLGAFDYIDCCGVLHHLADPPAALNLLVGALKPQGGIGLMLYGELGRRGVYDVQAVLRALADPASDHKAQTELARRLVQSLPPTNWFKRNPFVGDHATQGDAGLADLLLHARDRAYTVEQIAELAAQAGLRIITFAPPSRYEPERMVSDARIKARLQRLDPLQRAALAEKLAGNIKAHVCYLTRADNPVTPPSPDAPELIPVPFNADFAAMTKQLRPGAALSGTVDGLQMSFPLPARAPAFAGLVDGARSLGAIHAALAERQADLTWETFRDQFAAFFAAFNGLGKLFLRRP
jgi:SAM-dependent methyltransferase